MKALLLIFTFFIYSQAEVGTLVRIVDGDTLHFKTKGKLVKCRIEYIDSPESSNNNKNKRDIQSCMNVSAKDMKSAGKSATRAATRLLTLREQYEFKINGKDRYKRSICVVKLEDTTFNEKMILDGYAVPYRKYISTQELRYFESLLQESKRNKSGLWKDYSEAVECLDKARKIH